MTPLVLLPGMMCDARLFQHQIAAFSGRIPLLTMPMAAHDSMRAMAADVLSIAPSQFAVAGLSMGGILAMEILRLAPERISKVALLDTNPLAELDEIKARRAHQIAAVNSGGLKRVMRDEMKPNYLYDGPRKSEILDTCMEMALGLGPEVFINQSIALRDRIDQTETLRACRKPTLILCGRADVLCPVARHALMHDLMPQSQFEVIDRAGHLPTLEQPEETTAALQRWLEAP